MTKEAARPAMPDKKLQAPPAGSLGVRAYARRRTEAGHPISHAGIGKAIKTGRIARAVWRDEKGQPWIDPKLADELLDQNTDPSAQRETKAGGRPVEETPETLFAAGGPKPEEVRTSAPSAKDAPAVAFNESRATREGYEAELARLRYQKEIGELGRIDVMRARSENVGILVRDALRNIPARIAGELAAEAHAATIEERLLDEIDRALEGLAELARPYPS